MNRGLKITVGIVIIVAAMVYWTFQSLQGNEVYYMTVNDIKSSTLLKADTRVKLGGIVKTGSIDKQSPMDVNFQIMQDSIWVDVNYKGIIPDMFKDKAEVIIEGVYFDQLFVADNLIAKCASKYETNFEHEPGDDKSTPQSEV